MRLGGHDGIVKFCQYAEGGLKFWGHYSSENLVDWEYEGAALYPDSPFDLHGAYSGSAVEKDGALHLFYTGNVKRQTHSDRLDGAARQRNGV